MAIICGTDFSAQGSTAVRAAAALAGRLRQPLWLVHVLDDAIEALDTRARDLLVSAAESRLRAEARHLGVAVRRHARTKVLVGRPAEALSSLPDAGEPALVVVSSQGHGSSPLYRLGGTSERLAATSATPVLVVREAEPFEAWSRRARRLRVVVGVDFTPGCETAIDWVKTLRRAAPCDVTVAHVYYADQAHRRYGLHAASLLSVNPELERLLRRDLASLVGKMPGRGKVAFRPALGMGRLADQLIEVAESERADLIVVGTHHHRGVGRLASVASGALHMGRTAVAVVPNAERHARRSSTLPSVERVLIPTDFSDAANAAVRHGYGLLGHRGGEVHLLHVAAPARGRRRAELEPAVVARLRALVPATPLHRELVTRTHVAYGPVAPTIRDVAERLGVDVICMGSHGRTGVARALLGSVAAAVLKETRHPVLVVRSPR
jgi:nucleotide-binding universal stress UspA family protein